MQILNEEPNRNYFSLLFLIPEYLNAAWELFRSFILGYMHGPEYRESWESFLLRVVGLGFPGLSDHSPLDYVNSVRLGRMRSAWGARTNSACVTNWNEFNTGKKIFYGMKYMFDVFNMSVVIIVVCPKNRFINFLICLKLIVMFISGLFLHHPIHLSWILMTQNCKLALGFVVSVQLLLLKTLVRYINTTDLSGNLQFFL